MTLKAFFASQTIETLIDAITLPSFVLSVDEDGELRYRKLNAAHVATVGIPSEEIEGKTPHDFFPARVADTVLENYRTCQLENRSYCYEEVLNLNEQEYWWETTLSPLHDEHGAVNGVLGIATDITARKAKEFKAAKAYSDLQKMNEDVALFTSMTAHDVRGPLTKINILMEETLDGFEDLGDDKHDLVTMTQQVAKKALEYVDDILGYATALQTQSSKPVAFDVSHLCRDIAALVDPKARLQFSIPEIFIESESVVLQMIIRNLVENASRHAKSRISIIARAAPETSGFLNFIVADDGNGFPGGSEAFKKRIAMRQIDSGNRGFGLAAVAHLVETRNGKLWLDVSQFEGGTAISFTLPGEIVPEAETLDLPDAERMQESAPSDIAKNAVPVPE